MLGLIVNVVAIIAGTLIGLVAKKGIPESWNDQIMKALGLGVLLIGVIGCGDSDNPIVVIVSMVIGTIIGIALKLDDRVNNLGNFLEAKFSKESDGSSDSVSDVALKDDSKKGKFAQGFVTASILYCAGAMAIIAALEAGLHGDYQMLYTKSIMDFVPSILLASTLGVGVIFSSVMVFVYEGFFVLTANLIAPFLDAAVTNEVSAIGSVLLIAMSLNVCGISKFKIMNMVPAVFMPLALVPLYGMIFG